MAAAGGGFVRVAAADMEILRAGPAAAVAAAGRRGDLCIPVEEALKVIAAAEPPPVPGVLAGAGEVSLG